MSEVVRAFVAIKLAEVLVHPVAALQRELGGALSGPCVRWVRSDHLHLTLRFLGDVPVDGIRPLAQNLRLRLAGIAPARLGLEGIGAFPNLRRPRVLWVGIGGEVRRLAAIQREVEAACAGFGEPPEERTFHPHLTIGRVSPTDPRQAAAVGDAVRNLRFDATGDWLAAEVTLVRSQLTSAGPTYADLATIPFSPGATDRPLDPPPARSTR